jgi:TrpR family trp operon transcriptional repressor
MSAFKEITRILSEITDPEDIERFLIEIMTENERKDLSLRWDLMRKLHDGISQRAISAELGISLCKITRGSKILKSGDSIITKILNGNMK